MKRPPQNLLCIGLVLLLISQLSFAQTAPLADGFDTSKIVTLKGTMRGAWAVQGQVPALLMLEVADKAGKPEIWLVAGKPISVLLREGIPIIGPSPVVKSGDALAIEAYLPKAGSKVQPALAAALQEGRAPMKPGFIDDLAQNKARLARGIEITTADGKKIAFGNRE
jgi:hypothetical protein